MDQRILEILLSGHSHQLEGTKSNVSDLKQIVVLKRVLKWGKKI